MLLCLRYLTLARAAAAMLGGSEVVKMKLEARDLMASTMCLDAAM